LRGWQWLFLVQGLPSVVMGLVVLRFLPDTPASVPWLTADEKGWIAGTLTQEAASIGEPARHDLVAVLGNRRVLLLCATSFFASGVMTTFTLSAPLVLIALTGHDATHVGYLVSVGGVLGAATMLLAGAYADRRGDRFLFAFWLILVLAAALLAIAIAPSPLLVMAAYLGIAATCFTVNLLLPTGWADVLHVRELAVGAAAVNSVANLGGFVMPFAWGAARDATGSFTAGLVALALFSLIAATLALRVRAGLRRRQSINLAA
jgi:ACS family tartrate transporter-like MFS transporter